MHDLDFRNICQVDGSKDKGFEELCCQLYGTEPPSENSKYVRNGTPDGGVEAFWILPDSSEHGLQAKYIFSLDSSQWSQINDSVMTAINTHSKLSKYTICIPIDLPDPRVKGRSSQRMKWNQRVSNWNDMLSKEGRRIEFCLWGAHEIRTRLIQDKNAGKAQFFFDHKVLSPKWFKDHLEESIAYAGARYTKELSVDLPIASVFDSLGFTNSFRDKVRETAFALSKKHYDAILRRSVDVHRIEIKDQARVLMQKIESLVRCLFEISSAIPDKLDLIHQLYVILDSLSTQVFETIKHVRELSNMNQDSGRLDYQEQPSKGKSERFENYDYIKRELTSLLELTHRIRSDFRERQANLVHPQA